MPRDSSKNDKGVPLQKGGELPVKETTLLTPILTEASQAESHRNMK